MIRVKVCGMTDRADVDACVAAGADALGFIFAQSPRRLTIDEARALTAEVPPFVTTVGVFAGDAAELVREAIGACRLDVLQFSGDETAEFCGSFGKPTIVAAREKRWTAQARARARAIAVLVDVWSPIEFGGTGRLVPHETAQRARTDHEGAAIVLAGGLTPSNVAPLIRSVRPDAVDVRTGVENASRKDPELVRAFVAAARSAFDHHRKSL
ncbi:MAG TPA: phosphoribosylanthranilate isomerase [Candidatus Eremiobacteraceae bacterium]|nr:phosphoribosylanthranilate isomerase [Candidatus Eremiobacteraceae bacterium]